MNDTIYTCPFCGCDKVEICRTNENACWVRCSRCGADSESAKTREEAIIKWNRRVDINYAFIIEDQDKENKNV